MLQSGTRGGRSTQADTCSARGGRRTRRSRASRRISVRTSASIGGRPGLRADTSTGERRVDDASAGASLAAPRRRSNCSAAALGSRPQEVAGRVVRSAAGGRAGEERIPRVGARGSPAPSTAHAGQEARRTRVSRRRRRQRTQSKATSSGAGSLTLAAPQQEVSLTRSSICTPRALAAV
jgi:hypothetical protein